MTKTLTEQWREGTLPEVFYYILFSSRFGKDYIAIDMFIPDEKDFMYSSCEDVKEVLAPVPSYDEYKQLVSNSDESSRKALQLEKRLEECEEALKWAYIDCLDEGFETELGKKYLEKWGIEI